MTATEHARPHARLGHRRLMTASHVRAWALIVLAVVATATAGYVLLGGWNLNDALYMTVITLTTVGFKEVRDLDAITRAWTMLTAAAGVGLIFGSVGIIAEYAVTEVTSGRREARRNAKAIEELRNHFVLCGYGRVGSTVAAALMRDARPFVVIDVLEESLERARRDGHLTVEGDATDDATLRAAGVERAYGLIATIDSDANNVYVILSARALNPGLFVVARANTIAAEARLQQAGADRIVSPYTMAGRRIAQLAVRPRVVDFLDAALSRGEHEFSLEEIEVGDDGRFASRTVGELREQGIFALAVVNEDGTYEVPPSLDRRLQVGDNLILAGSSEALARLQ